jgi:hypothetical protein
MRISKGKGKKVAADKSKGKERIQRLSRKVFG